MTVEGGGGGGYSLHEMKRKHRMIVVFLVA